MPPLTVSACSFRFRLFGLPFLLMGAWGVWALVTGAAEVTVNGRPGRPSDAWLPGIFVLVGAGLAGIRWRRSVDPAVRCVRTCAGWGPFTRTRTVPFADATAVAVGPPEERGSGSGRFTAIPVRVQTPNGSLELADTRSGAQARAWGEAIARGAGLPLHDASVGRVVERPAETLDRPLLETVDADDLAAGRPPRSRVAVVDDGLGGVRIRIRPPPSALLAPLALLPLLLPLGFWWFVWRRDQPSTAEAVPQPWLLQVFEYAPLVLMVALPALVAGVVAMRRGTFGHQVRVDAVRGIRRGLRGIRPDRLEGLRFDRRHGSLVAIADHRELRLGHRLRDEDLTYLRAAVLRALRGVAEPVVEEAAGGRT